MENFHHDENDILHLSLHEFQGQNQELLEVFQRNCNKTDSRNLHSKISVQNRRHSNYLEILQLWLDDVWLHEDISSILTNHFGTSLRSPEKTITIFFSTQTQFPICSKNLLCTVRIKTNLFVSSEKIKQGFRDTFYAGLH